MTTEWAKEQERNATRERFSSEFKIGELPVPILFLALLHRAQPPVPIIRPWKEKFVAAIKS